MGIGCGNVDIGRGRRGLVLGRGWMCLDWRQEARGSLGRGGRGGLSNLAPWVSRVGIR